MTAYRRVKFNRGDHNKRFYFIHLGVSSIKNIGISKILIFTFRMGVKVMGSKKGTHHFSGRHGIILPEVRGHDQGHYLKNLVKKVEQFRGYVLIVGLQ